MSTVRSRVYRDGAIVDRDFAITKVSDHLADGACIVWVHLQDPTLDQLKGLAGELGLHELAIEDALKPHQRPKLDHYPDHLFLSCHATRVDVGEAELHDTEVDAFIGDRWLITTHHDGGFDIDSVVARWDRSPNLTRHGISFLLYGLLDVVVDGYFEAIDVFDEYYDAISETIFSDKPISPDQQMHWFQMRRALFQLHRLSVPTREAVSALMRRDHSVVDEAIYPYFQDVYDHILRVTESTDSLRDLVATIVETNLSLRDYRQNQVMKKVTSWAAIIAVPTLITGYYGMNVPYPGFASHHGVAVATGLMVAMSATLFLIFRQRDWL